MQGRQRAKRLVGKGLGLAALAACVWGIVLVYRWAEPDPTALRAVGAGSITQDLALRMDNTAYENYFGGARSWALHAERIDLMRLPGGSGLTGLQRAEITGINNGKLYDLPTAATSPPTLPRHPDAPVLVALPRAADLPTSDLPAEPPTATFSAQKGTYLTNMALTPPSDLATNYRVQWQFRMAGDVKVRTRDGDRLNAPSLTILQLINSRTGRSERRFLCDEGVQVDANNVHVYANSVRYDPATRRIECMGGVRCVLPNPRGQDTLQAERLFWSINGQTMQCPETATGVMHGMPFTTEGLNIDIKRMTFYGRSLYLRLPSSEDSPFSQP
jgi:hypothetical protein